MASAILIVGNTMTKQSTVYIPAGTVPAPGNMVKSPGKTTGSSFASVTTQGIKPRIGGGPVAQVALVNGTMIQTSKS